MKINIKTSYWDNLTLDNAKEKFDSIIWINSAGYLTMTILMLFKYYTFSIIVGAVLFITNFVIHMSFIKHKEKKNDVVG